jgi:ankyrin repeat protein
LSLECGAQIDVKTKNGWTGYLIHHDDVINAQNVEGNTALHEACIHGYFNVACLLLEGGASIMIQNNLNLAAVHIASRRRNLNLVYIMLSCSIHEII